MDKPKYEWGRTYGRLMLNCRKKSITDLIDIIDTYKLMAYKYESAADLGIADYLWDWVLEREYEKALS